MIRNKSTQQFRFKCFVPRSVAIAIAKQFRKYQVLHSDKTLRIDKILLYVFKHTRFLAHQYFKSYILECGLSLNSNIFELNNTLSNLLKKFQVDTTQQSLNLARIVFFSSDLKKRWMEENHLINEYELSLIQSGNVIDAIKQAFTQQFYQKTMFGSFTVLLHALKKEIDEELKDLLNKETTCMMKEIIESRALRQ